MFGYLRLFSILSLLTIIAISIAGGVIFHSVATDHLTQMIENSNVGMAQGYSNTVWKKYRSVIIPLAGDPARLRSDPQVPPFARETVQYFQNMPLVRVNLYSASGVLMMTINIGNGTLLSDTLASPDSAFVSSHIHTVTPASQIVRDPVLQNGDHAILVQTLAPLRADNTGSVAPEAMLEILYNNSPLAGQLTQFQYFGTGGVIALFLLFLGVLFLLFKKAEEIIARQHEANLELAEAAAAAQAENRDKSQFLANVSHELRTPLNAIIGFSDIIKTEMVAEISNSKYHDYINDIHSSGVHLLSLINDILDYSKAEAGKLELEVSEVNATKLVQNCLRLVAPRAESSAIKLVDGMPRDQFIMLIDSKKFKQILLNLLSNAVKFTHAGGKITVTGWRNVTDDTFSFEVCDTGIGIAPKDISRAMAPFGQVDSTLKRKYAGTGLGLPLTKKFVELMNGKFTIESKVDVGTKIVFTLPRELKEREGIVVKLVD